jgi:quercetin dioxygenase-like cupin family protein
MKKFDIVGMETFGYDQREKNVFFQSREFKMRVIGLAPGERLPKCEMATSVVFICLGGQADVNVGEEQISLSTGQGLVTEPAAVSMKTDAGARLLGIQIAKARAGTTGED